MGMGCCTKDEIDPTHDINALRSNDEIKDEAVFQYFIPTQTVANHVRNMSVHASKATGKLRSKAEFRKENLFSDVSPDQKEWFNFETVMHTSPRESTITFVPLILPAKMTRDKKPFIDVIVRFTDRDKTELDDSPSNQGNIRSDISSKKSGLADE